jgi:RHS repeat-associated protein
LARNRHSRTQRAFAAILVLLQALPAAAGAAPQAASREEPVQRPTSAPVKPNRTAPAIVQAPALPRFSTPPTAAEIFRARVFDEPLVPASGQQSAVEDTALAAAIMEHIRRGAPDDVSAFDAFLRTYPRSRWAGALLLDLGIVYRRTGYFSRALESWERSWALLKGEAEPRVKMLADRAVGELAELNARLGRYERLETLFAEIADRDVRGPAGEKVAGAREGFSVMQNEPERAFLCGPFGLDRILASVRKGYARDPLIAEARSTRQGTSMAQMLDLAAAVGLKMQIARRAPGAPVVTPALVHWKAGHFAALVDDSADRLLIQDPTFGDDLSISRTALDDEASGFFLVPEGDLPSGWEPLPRSAGEAVWGKGITSGSDPQPQGSCEPSQPECRTPDCRNGGMAGYTVNLMLVNLHISDTPVGYQPPLGPSMQFTIAYNQREAFQPQLPMYSNFGPKWTFDWFAYAEDDPTNAAANVNVYRRRGGQETYTNMATGTSTPHFRSRAVLVRTSATRYERRLSDGSTEVYAQPDGSLVYPRRFYLTETTDPQGNGATFAYSFEPTSGGLRLVSATDAIGQVTTLSYEHADPLRITRVTDPFGRFAEFDYDGSGRLSEITDVIGLASTFTYGAGDFIASLTTPYGTTSFATGGTGNDRWLETTDPLGAKEKFEYRSSTPQIPTTEAVVPSGMAIFNNYIHGRNTFYWDKRAYAAAAADGAPWYGKATIYHWLHTAASINVTSGVLESEKRPLERRVWYNYPGQTNGAHIEGSSGSPTVIGRVLDDGTTQLYKYEYNSRGKKLKEIDPVGRETVYVYGTGSTPDADQANGTGIDLVQIKQKNGGNYDVLASFTYDAQHQPLTVTGTASQTTSYTYNAQGQLATVTTPLRAGVTENRTTTYTYDPNGYLQTITGPATGATTSYTYDSYGRVRTTVDSESYVRTYDYDALDRSTRVTYPDGTSDETVYNRLDAEKTRDRLGRWTHRFHDALRRAVATRDPLGRTTTLQWCSCGSLDKVIDANQNTTTWERDLQGRITKETRADNSTSEFTYETTTSRLKTVKDAKAQDVQYSYLPDNRLQQVSYPTAQTSTPSVSFTYDPAFPRLATMTDGAGVAAYTYHPSGTTPPLGAGLLATVDGPNANDTISYGYDELERVVTRTLNGVTSTWAYDALGRRASQADPIGTFSYAFVGTTKRLESVTYPNGQVSSYTYFPNSGDQRLQEIHHKTGAGGTTLSRFTYTYDAVGNIKTWSQQYGPGTANAYDFWYDPADQLTAATYRTTDPTPAILKRYAYAYDPVGNRTTEQIDDSPVASVYDNMNRLTSQDGGGALTFKGTVSEPSTVTVGGKPAVVGVDNRFEGRTPVTPGTNTVGIVGADASGNTRTNTYQVTIASGPKSFSYDGNGSLTGVGIRTYDWDGQNRLVRALDSGSEVASFTYDGQGRRLRKTASGVTRVYVYDGGNIVEERPGTGNTVRYVYGPGLDRPIAAVDSAGTVSYSLADHLGNVIQTTNAAAQVTFTRQYDPYGNPLSGGGSSGYAFTGREWDAETSLYYYRARYYDAATGRFISQDPFGFKGGVNFYAYVLDNPVGNRDPFGLYALPVQLCPAGSPTENKYGTALCCRGGKYVLCADQTKWPQYSDEKKYCSQMHEQTHAAETSGAGGSGAGGSGAGGQCGQECSGDPCKPVSGPGGPGGECRAWWITYLCLRGTATVPDARDMLKDAEDIVKICRRGGF